MLRVLYVHESLGNLGGAEANVRITAGELRARGVQVGLWSRRPTGKGEEAWRALFGDAIYMQDQHDLASVIRAFKPDVVYVHKWDHLPGLEDLASCGLPVARMVHDHDIYCMRSYRYNPLTRAVCHRPASPYCVFPCLASVRRNRSGGFPIQWVSYFDKLREIAINRRFAKMFVVTHYMKRELELNGFDSSRIALFPPVPRPGEPLESSFSDRNLVLFAGQIIRGKGVDLMLRALARLKQPFEAVILGDGNHKAACEKLSSKLGLGDRVRFAGFLPQDELKAYYKDTSVVVVPSVWPEPIATIGLEVMRFGLPVVGFDAGGMSDWLHDGKTGCLVPWGNVEAMATAIDSLLSDKERARALGRNGREFVNREYDFEAYLERLHGTLAELAQTRASTTRP